METWTSPTRWCSSLWQGKSGTRGYGDLLAIPALLSSTAAGGQAGEELGWPYLGAVGGVQVGKKAPAPALGGALSASLMGWEAPCCSSGLPWYWDDAVPGLWASTSLPTRLLYWSEVGSHPRLMEAAMDGSRRHVLLAQGLGWPTALALDLPTWRIFWLDEKLGSIGSARLDGTSVKVCGVALVTGS